MVAKWFEREWWAALVSAIVGVLTAVGVVGPDDNALVTSITSMVLIVGPAMAFIISRQWAKTAEVKANAEVKIAQAKSEAQIELAKVTPISK